MKLGLEGRVALVAGASDGLGAAIARALAAEGASLALCARGEAKLNSTAQDIRGNYGVETRTAALDVRDVAATRKFVEDAASSFGRIDICVANAGGPPAKDFLSATEEDWQSAFELNLRSTIVLAHAVLPHMQRHRWGRVVTITSLAVRQPLPQLVLSNTVRTASLGLIRTLSNEFAHEGITFNNVAPGYTATARLKELAARLAAPSNRTTEEIEKEWIAGIPAGRLARPEEVADAVAWLASERAAMITGQTILIDGGMYKGV